ncbi:MAG TPA: hypothetical protein VJ793_10985 [Anaerolineae bacterium]|nr:hypothetical protein [Anaerolineae bacterium]
MDTEHEEKWQEQIQPQSVDAARAEDTAGESEAEHDTYYNLAQLTRIAYLARVLSWFSVGLGAVLLTINLLPLIQQPGLNFVQYVPTLVNALLIVLISGFFFVVLQGVSGGVYVLMDIEDNTRRTAEAMEASLEKA